MRAEHDRRAGRDRDRRQRALPLVGREVQLVAPVEIDDDRIGAPPGCSHVDRDRGGIRLRRSRLRRRGVEAEGPDVGVREQCDPEPAGFHDGRCPRDAERSAAERPQAEAVRMAERVDERLDAEVERMVVGHRHGVEPGPRDRGQ